MLRDTQDSVVDHYATVYREIDVCTVIGISTPLNFPRGVMSL